MLQPLFDSLSTAPPFGGGEGESAYRSFFVDAVAKQMVKAGGIGLAASVQREMVRMQAAGAAQGAAQSVASGQAATPKSAQTPKEESTS
jgi:Rod binding domain-containing protein